jgi:hypothetical protein
MIVRKEELKKGLFHTLTSHNFKIVLEVDDYSLDLNTGRQALSDQAHQPPH